MPASPQAGDLHVLYFGVKPYTTTVTPPSGWTLIPNTDGTNGTVGSGTDVGSIKQAAYYRYWQSGDPTTPSVGFSGASVGLGVIIRFRPTAGKTINVPVGDKGSDVSSGTDYAATMGADIGITVGDAVVSFTTIAGNNSTFGSPTLSATGVTFGTVTENPATEGSTSSGDDLEASGSTALPSAGPSSAAAVVGWTLSVAQTGMTALVRIRESSASTPVNQTTETDTSQAIGKVKNKGIGQNTETDLSQAITRIKQKLLGQNTETNTAQAIAKVKIRPVGQALETDLAQAITFSSGATPVGQVIETDTAQAIGKVKQAAIGQTSEADTAQAITRVKQVSVTQVSETDLAQAINKIKTREVGQVSEIDTAQIVAWAPKHRMVAQVTEADLAQGISSGGNILVSQVSETDTAQAVAKRKIKSVGQVGETDTAQAVGKRKLIVLSQVAETDLAQALFPNKRVSVVQVVEVDTSQPLSARKIMSLLQASEIDAAMSINAMGGGGVSKILKPSMSSMEGAMRNL